MRTAARCRRPPVAAPVAAGSTAGPSGVDAPAGCGPAPAPAGTPSSMHDARCWPPRSRRLELATRSADDGLEISELTNRGQSTFATTATSGNATNIAPVAAGTIDPARQARRSVTTWSADHVDAGQSAGSNHRPTTLRRAGIRRAEFRALSYCPVTLAVGRPRPARDPRYMEVHHGGGAGHRR